MKKKIIEKNHRLEAVHLKNKFLAEWASNVLELNHNNKVQYLNQTLSLLNEKDKNNLIIKKIEKDFSNNNIKISFDEIELKSKDFQIKAHIVVQNRVKQNIWYLTKQTNPINYLFIEAIWHKRIEKSLE